MRTAIAFTIGLAVGVAGAAVFFIRVDPIGSISSQTLADWPVAPAGGVVAPAAEAVAPVAQADPSTMSTGIAALPPIPPLQPASPPTPRPATPYYGPDPQTFVEPAPTIYRCRANGATSYSNRSCPGAAVVYETASVSGYDTRPSERLARLVARGRADDAYASRPTPRASSRAAAPIEATGTAECATLRRQIRDIDRSAPYAGSARQYDELQQIRRDIVTSVARLHC